MPLESDLSVFERKLTAIVELSDDAIFDLTLDGTITTWNRAAERLYGYAASEIIGNSVAVLGPPNQFDELPQILDRLRAGGRIENLESVRLLKDGRRVDVCLTIVPIDVEGSIVSATVVARDTTEQKQSKELFRELGAIVTSSNDAIIGKTLDGTITSWNGAAERLYGYAASEVIGSSVGILVPQSQVDELPQILDRLRAGERIEHFETVRLRKDGTETDVSLTISPIEHDGLIVGASMIARDVTNRKRAEREATEMLGLLEAIEASAPVGFGFIDREFRIVRINETLAAVNGGTIEEQIGRTVAEVVPELWTHLKSIYLKILETGEPVIGEELAGPSARWGGDVRNWLTSFHPVWVDDEISGIGIVILDITERKQAEEALRTAKEDAERLIATSNAIVLALDIDANVKTINKAGEEITGYTCEELQGRNWDIVVPRDRYPDAWAAHAASISGPGLARYENPILTKSGEERIVLWRNSQVLEQDQVIGTLSFGVDVTESVRAGHEASKNHELLRIGDEERRRLLNRLVHAQEEERRRIAGEIHDDPLQALASLAWALDLLATKIEDPTLLVELSEAREAVRAAAASLRQLIFNLHPPILDREGLGRAVDAQLEQLRQETGIEVILESKLIQEPPVATSTIAYRIVQEALMNVRKHARAEHVNVRLAQSAGGLLVGITDDGRGFEPAASAPGHLGLVAMRERAEMAGGWFRIESDPTQGTAVDFLLPTIAA